jgi:hypothetical protein
MGMFLVMRWLRSLHAEGLGTQEEFFLKSREEFPALFLFRPHPPAPSPSAEGAVLYIFNGYLIFHFYIFFSKQSHPLASSLGGEGAVLLIFDGYLGFHFNVCSLMNYLTLQLPLLKERERCFLSLMDI